MDRNRMKVVNHKKNNHKNNETAEREEKKEERRGKKTVKAAAKTIQSAGSSWPAGGTDVSYKTSEEAIFLIEF